MQGEPEPPTYSEVAGLLQWYADQLDSELHQISIAPGKPIYWFSVPGTDPSLPAVCLNSHMDVVPVEADKWTVGPWNADIIDGKLYGRGTQDMKLVV